MSTWNQPKQGIEKSCSTCLKPISPESMKLLLTICTRVPGTRSARIYQCTFIFIGMVNDLKGLNIGCLVDLHEHSRQTATRALKDGADEETVICGLLHDIGGKNSNPNFYVNKYLLGRK